MILECLLLEFNNDIHRQSVGGAPLTPACLASIASYSANGQLYAWHSTDETAIMKLPDLLLYTYMYLQQWHNGTGVGDKPIQFFLMSNHLVRSQIRSL